MIRETGRQIVDKCLKKWPENGLDIFLLIRFGVTNLKNLSVRWLSKIKIRLEKAAIAYLQLVVDEGVEGSKVDTLLVFHCRNIGNQLLN
jgi:hypothetical protein